MFISTNPQFVYVSLTKSGSSSMYNVLTNNFKGIRTKRTRKKVPEQYTTFPSFTVVRNPYSRLLSWWWSICKTPGDRYGHKKELQKRGLSESFEDFLVLWGEKNGTGQARVVDINRIDHIIKIEHLEEQFNTLPFIKEHIKIPQVNKREHPHWKDFISTEAGELINIIYRKDFETFDYEILDF